MSINGKIYKLFNDDDSYIGSTTLPKIEDRLAQHRKDYKKWKNGKFRYVTSFAILEKGNCSIVLLEEVRCDTKSELHARERHWIENTECVNKHIPTRTIKEWHKENREYKKNYYEKNKEQLLEQAKQYRKENKEQINRKRRENRLKKKQTI